MVQRYENLTKEINKCKPKTILEIGTWNAINSSAMIRCAKQYNSDIKYYGFDMFDMNDETKKLEMHVKKNATELEARKRLDSTGIKYELIIGNTLETLPNFVPDRKIDFAYIDGGHSLETIANDWKYIEKLMHFDTVVLFDDYYHNRDDVGCKTLIRSLDPTVYNVYLLEPRDHISDDLEINIAKVQKNYR